MAQTNRQKEIIAKFNSTLFFKVEGFLQDALSAKEAVVSLPSVTEAGEPVVHRDNMTMHSIIEINKYLAQLLIPRLSKEEEDKIEAKFPDWRAW